MESIFYVILWYGIRYLDHNCRDVGYFIYKYFDEATIRDDKYFCGQFKGDAVKTGQITIPGAGQQLKFLRPSDDGAAAAHPFGVVINDFLRLIQSRYNLLPPDPI